VLGVRPTTPQLKKKEQNITKLYTDLDASPNIIRVKKISMVRWEENVARVAEVRNTYKL